MIQDNKKYVEFLISKGYVVTEQDGILTIAFGDVSEREAKNKIIEVNELLASKGFNKSLGFRWKNPGGAVPKPKREPIQTELPKVEYDVEDEGQLTFGF